jgi:hypothetical protein
MPPLALMAFGLVLSLRIQWTKEKRLKQEPPPDSAAATKRNTEEVFVDPNRGWYAYLNVYNSGSDGGGLDHRTNLNPAVMNAGFQDGKLFVGAMHSHPPDRSPDDANWWLPDGTGRKRMQSYFYVENDRLGGRTVVFSGTCLSNTFSPELGFKAEAVVYSYTSDYLGREAASAPLVSGGDFRVSLPTQPGSHVQYGIWIIGPNVRPERVEEAGRVWVATQTRPPALPPPVFNHFSNHGFEASGFTASQGNVAAKEGNIPGWTLSNPSAAGLDVQGGVVANNGAVPNGVNVAFVRSRNGEAATLETSIANLIPGRRYRVGFRANSREGGGEPSPQWSINGGDFHPFKAWPPVGGTNPFHMNSGGFIATGPVAKLVVRNRSGPDSVVIVDDFFAVPVPGIDLDMGQRRGSGEAATRRN